MQFHQNHRSAKVLVVDIDGRCKTSELSIPPKGCVSGARDLPAHRHRKIFEFYHQAEFGVKKIGRYRQKGIILELVERRGAG